MSWPGEKLLLSCSRARNNPQLLACTCNPPAADSPRPSAAAPTCWTTPSSCWQQPAQTRCWSATVPSAVSGGSRMQGGDDSSKQAGRRRALGSWRSCLRYSCQHPSARQLLGISCSSSSTACIVPYRVLLLVRQPAAGHMLTHPACLPHVLPPQSARNTMNWRQSPTASWPSEALGGVGWGAREAALAATHRASQGWQAQLSLLHAQQGAL
jgi:hypothetical protein